MIKIEKTETLAPLFALLEHLHISEEVRQHIASKIDVRDTEKYNFWAADMIREMQQLSSGIQLADEGLHKRTDHFMKPEKLKRVQEIRAQRDPHGVFFEWHSHPGG